MHDAIDHFQTHILQPESKPLNLRDAALPAQDEIEREGHVLRRLCPFESAANWGERKRFDAVALRIEISTRAEAEVRTKINAAVVSKIQPSEHFAIAVVVETDVHPSINQDKF